MSDKSAIYTPWDGPVEDMPKVIRGLEAGLALPSTSPETGIHYRREIASLKNRIHQVLSARNHVVPDLLEEIAKSQGLLEAGGPEWLMRGYYERRIEELRSNIKLWLELENKADEST